MRAVLGDALNAEWGQNFTTYDSDNTVSSEDVCPILINSGWWQTACNNSVDLNQPNGSTFGIYWNTFDYFLFHTEMKIKPIWTSNELLNRR